MSCYLNTGVTRYLLGQTDCFLLGLGVAEKGRESADTLEETVGAWGSLKAGYVSNVTRVGALTHLEFLSNTGENTWKKLSFASLLEGTELSKVGSTLLNARLFAGSDSIS